MTTALIIIDLQNAILRGLGTSERQPAIDAALDAMTARVAEVQTKARKAGIPIVAVQHDGATGHRLQTGSEGWALRAEIAPLPGEPVVHKTACDSFFATDLQATLERLAAHHLIVAGCMSQFCVDTTCRRAVSLGYDVTLLSDGHMTADMGSLTFDQIIAHHNALLGGFDAGHRTVTLTTCEEVPFER